MTYLLKTIFQCGIFVLLYYVHDGLGALHTPRWWKLPAVVDFSAEEKDLANTEFSSDETRDQMSHRNWMSSDNTLSSSRTASSYESQSSSDTVSSIDTEEKHIQTRGYRKCTQCPKDMLKKWRDRSIQWICGGYQRARRTFKSQCMMKYRNCQDGTMFVEMYPQPCLNDTHRGKHWFYVYKVD